jgi:MFS family permease
MCGVAHSQLILIAARATQGLGGAIVTSVALSLILNLFTEPSLRARAMGVYSFVAAAGGSVGLLVGGILTNSYDWHWNFLVNIPIGIAVFVLSLMLVPGGKMESAHKHLDIAGAIVVTTSLIFQVYAIVGGNQAGWLSGKTLIPLVAGIILLIIFFIIESKVRAPLMPLRLFRLRNLITANVMAVLWAAAMFAWFFLTALYLQLILKYDPLQIGLGFLPGNVIMAAFSLGLSAKIVTRYGIKGPLATGLAIAAVGFLYLSRAPVDGHYVTDILPSMLLLGFGAGMAFNPMLLAAMGDVSEKDSGLASGLVNTSFMMGGALGLAVLASFAAAKTTGLMGEGLSQIESLNGGYHLAFFLGAVSALAAALLGIFGLRIKKNSEVSQEAIM